MSRPTSQPHHLIADQFIPDPQQQKAIDHVDGPMLVIAGAGTGKTTVLARRIARLIENGYARPDEILALTYGEKAAGEMTERVQEVLKNPSLRPGSFNFHSYCLRLLLESGQNFSLLDEKDLWVFLRRRIRELNLKHFVRAANVGQFLCDLLEFISRCQDQLVSAEDYAAYVKRVERGECLPPRVAKAKEQISAEQALDRCREISQVYSTVENMLRAENLGTFGHMITGAYALLRDDAQLLAREQQRARYILVDEFQDVNFAQIEILKMLAAKTRNLFVVGDPDQAIYNFRGASSEAFRLFVQAFPDSGLTVLGKNRRSLSPILASAFAIINQNPQLFAASEPGPETVLNYRREPLQSAREEAMVEKGESLQSEPVGLVRWKEKKTEAFDVVTNILERRKLRKPPVWKQFAILYRSHANRLEVVDELLANNIPISIEGMNVLDTPEVRDLWAALLALVNPGDGASQFRVAAFPQFGIDPGELQSAMKAARDLTSLDPILQKIPNGPRLLDKLQSVRSQVNSLGGKAARALEIVGREFQLDLGHPAAQALLQFAWDWEDKAITSTGTPREFVEYMDYFVEAGGSVCPASTATMDGVRVMSAHAAKGLEFDHVYILRAATGSFPTNYKESLFEFPATLGSAAKPRALSDKELHNQEERRLFYVAMTRAKDTLSISGKEGVGKKDKTPTGMIREMVDKLTKAGVVQSRTPVMPQQELFGADGPARMINARSLVADWVSSMIAVPVNPRLSASAIESYQRCPLQYKMQRVLNIPSEPAGAMQFGGSIHHVLKTYFDAIRLGRDISDERLLDDLRKDLENSGMSDSYQQDLYQKQGQEQLRAVLEGLRSHPPATVLHTEESFQIEVEGVQVAGRVDRIDRNSDGSVTIVDYKTGKAKDQEQADKALQLSLYALAAQVKWGYQVSGLQLHNIADNSIVTSTRSPADLKKAAEMVKETAEQIAAGNFEAKPGNHCGYCSYRNLCPKTETRLPDNRKSLAAN